MRGAGGGGREPESTSCRRRGPGDAPSGMKFLRYLGVKDPSYAADPNAAAAFFRAAADYWDLAPWEVLGENEPLEVEGLDPQPLLVAVRGEETEPGLALFASRKDWKEGRPRAWLQFENEPPGPAMAAEIEEGRWPLGQPDAIPVAAEPGQVASPATLALLARAMHVVARFLKAGLEEEDSVRQRQLKLPSGLKVWVTWEGDRDVFGTPTATPAPAEPAAKKPAGPPPVVKEAKPGRNEPCWCGSGQKYKKCHLAQDEAAARGGG